MAQYTVVGTVLDSEGVEHDVLQAEYAPTRKGVNYEKWFVCPTCLRSYPVSQGAVVQGRRYCTVEPCADDARSK